MKRIFAISLLFIFVSGQVNLTWATHYCGSFAVDNSITFGEEKLTCGTEQYCCSEESPDVDGPVIVNEDCCSNDYHSVDADDYFTKIESSFDRQLLFSAAFVISLFDFSPNNDALNFYLASSPPLIQSDRQVLYQTFLL